MKVSFEYTRHPFNCSKWQKKTSFAGHHLAGCHTSTYLAFAVNSGEIEQKTTSVEKCFRDTVTVMW